MLAPSAIRILSVSEKGVLYFAVCAYACCQRFRLSVWAVWSQCQPKCLLGEGVPYLRKEGQVGNRKPGFSVKMLLFLPFWPCKLKSANSAHSDQWLTLLGHYKCLYFVQTNSHTFFVSSAPSWAVWGAFPLLPAIPLTQLWSGTGIWWWWGSLCFNITRK